MNHTNQDTAYIFSIVVTILVQTANWTCWVSSCAPCF